MGVQRLWWALFFGLTGCTGLFTTAPSIEVMRQVIDRDFYASAQIGTPDPQAPHYLEGECLVIRWCVPKDWVGTDAKVLLEVVYRNRERQQQQWPILAKEQTIRVSSMGEEFCRTRGFLTYKVSIIDQGQTLVSAPHQLWFNWIDPAAQESASE